MKSVLYVCHECERGLFEADGKLTQTIKIKCRRCGFGNVLTEKSKVRPIADLTTESKVSDGAARLFEK